MVLPLSVQESHLLSAISGAASRKKIALYLVGGYLRDALLKRKKENPDFDFCLARGALAFGRALARSLKAGFVVLDKGHASCRVVRKMGGKAYTLDFTDFRGKTLAQDLLHRDFTLNTMALALDDAVAGKPLQDSLIDLYGAQKDIAAKVVRLTYPGAFDEDPLRILRAFSLSATFRFTIEKETLGKASRKRKLLKSVSWERIRDEIFRILDAPDSAAVLTQLDEVSILGLVFPEIEPMRALAQGPYHHLDVLKHSIETVRKWEGLEIQMRRREYLAQYLDEPLSSGRKRRALVKLAALLHDIGKPKALRREDGKLKFHGHEAIGARMSQEAARRLRLSNEEADALRKMVMWHLRPGYLGDSLVVSARARFRYFRDTGSEGASILLLSLADQRATKGPLTTAKSRRMHETVCRRLLKEYFRNLEVEKVPRLLNGNDLMKEFGLSPSPLIGTMLGRLEELQAIGKITTREEALKCAARIYKTLRHARSRY